MSALRKAPWMLHTLTLYYSCASVFAASSTDSVETMGEGVCPGTTFLCYLCPYLHDQPFTLPSLLNIKNIEYLSASRFYSLVRCLLIWDKIYTSCGAETAPMLLPSPPFPQFPSAQPLCECICNHCCRVYCLLRIFHSLILQEKQCILV